MDPSLAGHQAFLTGVITERKEEAANFALTYGQVTVSCQYRTHTLKKCITRWFVKPIFSQIRSKMMLLFCKSLKISRFLRNYVNNTV